MYLTTDAILASIKILRAYVHPFLGITFVACRRIKISIGSFDEVSLDSITREHMEAHHRIDRRSKYFFQPFKSNPWWVANRYPSSGLQTVNTQTFSSAFIHPRNQPKWGFAKDYLARIKEILKQNSYPTNVPVDALAIWLYKDQNIGDIASYDQLVEKFFVDFNISEDERLQLFSLRMMTDVFGQTSAFSAEPLELNSVAKELPEPPDAAADGGRTITSLRLANAGPVHEVKLDFGKRLTVVTGDNGLGKSFLLDFTWWAATGSWPEREVLPSIDCGLRPQVDYSLSTLSGRSRTFTSRFEQKTFSWTRPNDSMTIEALAIFSRSDGSYAIADPVRARFNRNSHSSVCLSGFEVWNGRTGIIEGLIRDWVIWQTSPDQKAFDQFCAVLKRLSPDDLGALTPGPTIRLPGDAREIPTIQHRYGSVPVTLASSGVKRVLLLAYLMIWSWQEHELAASRLGQLRLRRMMVIVDELEAHLHPKWQRIVLPALMKVGDLLSSDLAVQTIAATHSPMILASLESTFDSGLDLLYHLYGEGAEVKLEEIAFVKYGDASGWLTSPLFGLRHARSREAEVAIESAKALQLMDQPPSAEIEAVSRRLQANLSGDDKFWPRWLYFAEKHGVIL